jgi:hypothetical protein
MAISVKLLSPTEKAKELGVTRETLRRWRLAGTGPAWKRVGPNIIRYLPEIIEQEDAA